MASGNQREVPAELARGRDRLTAWRRTRKPQARIPERLWELAVTLAAEHGLHRTAQALKLDYYSLKQRIETAEPVRDESDTAFIELPSLGAAGRECVIEFEEGAVSLRVHLKGYSAADIAAVGRGVRGLK